MLTRLVVAAACVGTAVIGLASTASAQPKIIDSSTTIVINANNPLPNVVDVVSNTVLFPH
jgi:hypothetical protein